VELGRDPLEPRAEGIDCQRADDAIPLGPDAPLVSVLVWRAYGDLPVSLLDRFGGAAGVWFAGEEEEVQHVARLREVGSACLELS
jgi:hypothetical protein